METDLYQENTENTPTSAAVHDEELLFHTIECMLFVAGDPVPITELSRVLDQPKAQMKALLDQMEARYRDEKRGIQLLVTEDAVQLTSNPLYIDSVNALLQPDKTKSVSQSLLETLAIVAYRQPVTRADVESVRGVRCDYAVTQLVKLGLIVEVGRKDVVGRPVLFGTTDRFLRQFGIHSVDEMPDYSRFCHEETTDPDDAGEVIV